MFFLLHSFPFLNLSITSQVRRGWLKKVQQEWSILERDLPGENFNLLFCSSMSNDVISTFCYSFLYLPMFLASISHTCSVKDG